MTSNNLLKFTLIKLKYINKFYGEIVYESNHYILFLLLITIVRLYL